MKIAHMFPGQGSQSIGMGQDLYSDVSGVKHMFDEATRLLGYDVPQMIFSGKIEQLSQTEYTQPAILLVSLALWECLKKNISSSDYCVLGHSLGEYSAYVASNRLSFQDALCLVQARGQIMAASSSEEFGMAAILKLPVDILEKILESHGKGEVFLANDNSPNQIVVSGLKVGIERLESFVKQEGGKTIPLNVSGAFHSPYMEKASAEFSKKLETIRFQASSIPLYTNLTALPLKVGEEVQSLEKQMYQPVRFREMIENLVQREGITRFVEVGPGKVLQGLVKRIYPDIEVFGVANMDDIQAIEKEGI